MRIRPPPPGSPTSRICREAWEFLQFGNAAAMSWMLFAVVFSATWLHFRFLDARRAHA